jgi:hypothetical protein
MWFLAEAPANRVAGTLHYSERGLHLKLLGSFKEGWTLKPESYSLIHGVVSKNPYGEFVTLIDPFTKQRRLSSSGIGSQTIYCNRGIVGDSHLDPNHDNFAALDFTVTNLGDWFGRRGLSVKLVPGEKLDLEVHYGKPDAIRFSVGDQELTIGSHAKWKESSYEFNLKENVVFFIEPLPRLTVEGIHRDYVRPLQNLLTFATDTPNAVELFRLRGEKVSVGKTEWRREYHYLYDPVFRPRGRKQPVSPHEMLFTFDEALGAGLDIFEAWVQFTKRHEVFCTDYFAFLYAPPRYLDEKLLRLMSAFTLLTTSLGDVSARTLSFTQALDDLKKGCFTEAEQNLLAPCMPTSLEIEMPFRLRNLMEERRALLSPFVGDEFGAFVESLCKNLSFAQRRRVEEGFLPMPNHKLYYATQIVHMIIKIVMLEELGFSEEQVRKSIVRRNQLLQVRGL